MDEDDIEKARRQDQAKSSPAKRSAAEAERRIKIYTEAAFKAKKAKDARAFAAALRFGNVSEGSKEWKAAWEYFYS